MPPSDHFESGELKFDGGLWSVSDYLVPPNGAVQMYDCYPQKAGGLRAWARMQTRSTSGVGATEEPVGFFARGGVQNRVGSGTSTDFYLATGTTGSQVKLYRWDETVDPDPTSWTLLRTFTAGTGKGKTYWQVFTPSVSGSPIAVYMSHDNSGSSEQGLWRIRYSDGVVTQITSHNGIRAFVIHQDRLLYGTTEQSGTRLRYSNAGSETFDAANTLDVLPDWNLADNAFARSYVGELLLGKEGAPVTIVQADINDPSVQVRSDAAAPGIHQVVTETAEGVVFVAYRDGYYEMQAGFEVTPLDDQINPDDIAGSSALKTGTLSGLPVHVVYAPPWIVTPSGHIFDTRTRVWFRTSEWGPGQSRAICKILNYDKHAGEHRVYALTNVAPFEILYFDPDEGQMARKSSYTYKSPQLRRPDGRRMRIREVHLPIKSFNTGSRVDVTVNGVTRRITGISSGTQVLRFPFVEEAEYLDVTIVPDSLSASVEAPAIEAGVLKTQPGHLYAPETVTTV